MPLAGERVAAERQRTAVMHAYVQEGAWLPLLHHHEDLAAKEFGGHGPLRWDVLHGDQGLSHRGLLRPDLDSRPPISRRFRLPQGAVDACRAATLRPAQ